MIDNRVLKPISEFIVTNKLKWNGQTLMISVDVALTYAVIPNMQLAEVEKVSNIYAKIINLRLTGNDKAHPLRINYDVDVFVENTVKLFTFVKNEMLLKKHPLMTGLRAIQNELAGSEEE
mgnify:FL=1